MKLSISHLIGLGQRAEAQSEEDEDKEKKPAPDAEGGEGEGEQQANQEAARQAALAAARAEGAAAERARIAGILGCEEAAGRGDLALHLACETDTPVDAARAALAKAPKQAKGTLGQLMGTMAPNPQISPQGGSDTDTAAVAAAWDRSVKRVNERMGFGKAA